MKFNKLLFTAIAVLSLSSCTTDNNSTNFSSGSVSPDSSQSQWQSSSTGPMGNKKLVFFSVNDTHGSIEEDPANYIAGLAKMRDIIYSDPDYDKSNSIILSSGDMFQGSGLSNLTKGVAMTQIMETFPFDAMAIGNHEFDWGLKNLIEIIKPHHSFPILNSNIYEGDNLLAGTVPSTIVSRGNYKIGIIGSIQSGIESSIAYTQVKNFTIKNDAPLVVAEAEKLKDQGADVVVLATHQGSTSAVRQIASSKLVDAIFLGHTHAVIDNVIDGVPAVEAGSNAKAYTKVILEDREGDFSLVSQEVHQVSRDEIEMAQIAPDIQAIIDDAKADVQPILDEEVVTTDAYFSRYENPSFPNNGSMGRLITQSMYEYGVKTGLTNLVAVHNKGGVRKDFSCSGNVCTMTYGDLYEISPFDNEVRYVQIKGSSLYSAISSHYYYEEIGAIDPEATYNVLTIDYLTTTPGYPLYSEDGGQRPGGNTVYIRDLLKEVLQSKGSIKASDYPF